MADHLATNSLTWTDEPPTEPGLCLYRLKDDSNEHVDVFWFTQEELDKGGWTLGSLFCPIPEPTEPEEAGS